MKKLLSVFAAVALFAACKGKTADANTAAATTTTPATNAPAADAKAAYAEKSITCVCGIYTQIDELYKKAEAAAEADKAALMGQVEQLMRNEPPCVVEGKAEEAKITASMSEAEKLEFGKNLDEALHKKCPDAAAAVEKLQLGSQ